VQFLNQVSKVEQALYVAWQSSVPSTAEKSLAMINSVNAEVNALTPHVNLIDLEGPAEVAIICGRLQVRLSLEMTALAVAIAFSRNKIGAISINNYEVFTKVFLERLEVKTRATKKMQETLKADTENQRV